MKKILITTDNFLPRWDGISRFLSEVIPGLKKDFEVVVVCPNFGRFKPEGYRVVKVKLSNFGVGDYVSAKFSRKVIEDEVKKCDIVFSQTIGSIGALGVWYGSKHKKKVVSFVHSIEWELVPRATSVSFFKRALYPLVKLYSRYLHNLCDVLILPSESTSEVISWAGLKSKKEVVYLGVDSNKFISFNERSDKDKLKIEKLRKELKLEKSFVVGYHGRIAREKDLYTLLNAFKWLKKVDDNCKLLIVGDGVLEIKERILKNKDVIVTGFKDDVELYLNLFDVYVTPSLTETTSLTTLEAMSSELVVISTPVGFIKDYIKDTYNGFLFPQGNSYMLFKLLELVKTNASLRRDVGKRARRTVTSKFSWDNTRENIKNILKEI
ncbi:MAG: glycosyltransferase family 4 protein [Candidatus Woesearchaeota archaeon]